MNWQKLWQALTLFHLAGENRGQLFLGRRKGAHFDGDDVVTLQHPAPSRENFSHEFGRHERILCRGADVLVVLQGQVHALLVLNDLHSLLGGDELAHWSIKVYN